MISHVVYRNRNNLIVLQLQNDGAVPPGIVSVEVCISPAGVHVETGVSPFAVYAPLTGILTLQLGRVPEVIALTDVSYMAEVTAFTVGDSNGTLFGSFNFTLQDAC